MICSRSAVRPSSVATDPARSFRTEKPASRSSPRSRSGGWCRNTPPSGCPRSP